MEALVASVGLHTPLLEVRRVLTKPDFSKLGGGAGGMPDMGDLGDEPEEGADEDEDMPGLEEDEAEGEEGKGKGKEAGEPAAKAKIEEVS